MCLYIEALFTCFNTKYLLRSSKLRSNLRFVWLLPELPVINAGTHGAVRRSVQTHPQNSKLVNQIVIQYKQPSALSDWAEATKRPFVKLLFISAEPEQQRTFSQLEGHSEKTHLDSETTETDWIMFGITQLTQSSILNEAAEKSESDSEKSNTTKNCKLEH